MKKEVKSENSKIQQLQNKVNDLEAVLDAIKRGEVDSLLIQNKQGSGSIFTLEGEDKPYRSLIEGLSEGAITLSEEGIFIYCNKRFCDMVELPLNDIINSSIYQYIPKRQHELLKIFLQKNSDHASSEFTLQVKDSTLSVLLTCHNVSFGKVNGLSIIVSDVSNWKKEQIERIKAQQELIKNEELFHQFADNVNVVFWRMTPTLDRLTYISPAYENMWGLSCDTLYSNPLEWLEAVCAEDKDNATSFLESLKINEYNSTQFKIVDIHGKMKNIFAKGFQVIKKNGQISCICGIYNDITELTKIKERAHLSDKLSTIGTLAAGIVHEVKNPVAWIMTNLEYIRRKKGTLDPEKLDQALADSLDGAKRIHDIVCNLKGFVRVESSDIEDIDLTEIFSSVLKMAYSETKRRARVETRFSNDLPLIKANTGRLQQVFLNLVMNAAQSIPEGNFENNLICITIEEKNKYIRIDVSDTGCGIAPENISKIYDPFYTAKAPGIGTGLGLSITHEIVRSLGGYITLKSTLGKGSTFSVFFPFLDVNV